MRAGPRATPTRGCLRTRRGGRRHPTRSCLHRSHLEPKHTHAPTHRSVSPDPTFRASPKIHSAIGPPALRHTTWSRCEASPAPPMRSGRELDACKAACKAAEARLLRSNRRPRGGGGRLQRWGATHARMQASACMHGERKCATRALQGDRSCARWPLPPH